MEKLSITLLNTVLNTFFKLLLISGYRNSLLARYSNYCKLFTVPDLSKRKRSAAGGCSIRSRASAMSLITYSRCRTRYSKGLRRQQGYLCMIELPHSYVG